ncbi:MAG: MBL fold metallo-hydrolase [Planctomycetota bacterium]|jgi:L-ascorbate metabolism protein UlaG (beta-lactamase superfamily)
MMGKGKRWIKRMLLSIVLVLCLLLILASIGLMMVWNELGKKADGQRLTRIKQSPNYMNGKFQNPIPTDNSFGLSKIIKTIRDYSGGQKRFPVEPLPIVKLSKETFSKPLDSGLRLTWLGHSTVLVEIDGNIVLFDPVFRERASPLSFLGPKRFHPIPVSIPDLPPLDAVVISHDHFDHLEYKSILELSPKTKAFYVPLGVGSHLEYWGVLPEKIHALDWWEERKIDNSLRLIACPARHFSGRLGFGDRTLWASWVLIGDSHRLFHCGDTGIMPLFNKVGEQFGPFDATFIKIGAYGRTWHDIHVDPEEALEVHKMLRGNLFIPIHWGTFSLSYHGWSEPVERLLFASKDMGQKIAIPKPGQPIQTEKPPAVTRWWSSRN